MLFIEVRHGLGAGRLPNVSMPVGHCCRHWSAVWCCLHVAMLLLALLLLSDRQSLVGELLCALPRVSGKAEAPGSPKVDPPLSLLRLLSDRIPSCCPSDG